MGKIRIIKRRKFNILGLFPIILFIFSSPANSENNRYLVANNEMKVIYEHFFGVSLHAAIENLLKGKYEVPKDLDNQLRIRFNGGGGDNCLFIGQKNTLKIIIENQTHLSGLNLGIEFGCTAGSFKWVEGYGSITSIDTVYGDILEINRRAFAGRKPWETLIYASEYPNRIFISARSAPDDFEHLPPHEKLTWLYSMQIELPNDTSMVGGEFCVQIADYPVEQGCAFIDAATDQKIVPFLQGDTKKCGSARNITQVCFDIIDDPICRYTIFNPDTNTYRCDVGMTHPWDIPDVDFNGIADRVSTDTSRIIYVDASIIFEGDANCLKALGVRLLKKPIEGKLPFVMLPLKNLPKICQVKGVKCIKWEGANVIDLLRN
jgi:hypothetical protein